jgi:NAD(P)-dependent dehydrogenase (short-subunit alcohol dehydrogenase family)
MARVIAWEHPSLHAVLVDLDPTQQDDDVEHLAEETCSASPDDEVAFRRSIRYVPRLVQREEHASDALPTAQESLSCVPPVDEGKRDKVVVRHPETDAVAIHDQATYLITGGLGGIGMALAEWLVDRGARSLVLSSRRGKPSDEARQTIARLESRGAQVHVVQADVSVQSDVEKLLGYIGNQLPPLRGIFHAAGILDDGVLMKQDWKRFRGVLAAKVAGAFHLYQATQAMPLDAFVSFSSAASVFGSPGQANYAAANAFLDALAYRAMASGRRSLSVNWGPWDAIGMAAGKEQHDRARWAAGGMETIPADDGLDILEQLLRQNRPQVAVLPITWSKFLQHVPRVEGRTLLAELAKQVDSKPVGAMAESKRSNIMGKVREASGEQQAELVSGYVLERIAATLGVRVEQYDAGQPLMATGLDSLMVLEIKAQVEGDLEIELLPEIFVENMTGKALADKVAVLVRESLDAETNGPADSRSEDSVSCDASEETATCVAES